VAGVQQGAKQVTFNGMDGPVLDKTPDFLKALDLDHARDGEVMLPYGIADLRQHPAARCQGQESLLAGRSGQDDQGLRRPDRGKRRGRDRRLPGDHLLRRRPGLDPKRVSDPANPVDDYAKCHRSCEKLRNCHDIGRFWPNPAIV
jgi:hypothetical protein